MQGKESICVDLSTPEGLALVHELARRSDLVLQGFRAGAAERLGVDAATLCSMNPDLVYLAAPGYGTGPPCGHRPSFAPSIGAAGGIALANLGDTVAEAPGLDLDQVRDGAIRLSGAGAQTNAQADGLAALGVATSLLLGLVARERGAGGQTMVASMLSTIAHAMGAHVVDVPGTAGTATPDHELRGTRCEISHLRRDRRLGVPRRALRARVGAARRRPCALRRTSQVMAGSPTSPTDAATTRSSRTCSRSSSHRAARTTGNAARPRRRRVCRGHDGQHRNHVVERLVLGRRGLPGRRRAPDLRDPSPTRSAGSLLSLSTPCRARRPRRIGH